jgi:hypothetical protein
MASFAFWLALAAFSLFMTCREITRMPPREEDHDEQP